MKVKFCFHFVILMLAVVVNSCQKIERDNIWDEKAQYDPNAWAPTNLVLTVNDTSSITLKWEQSEIVEGFNIERKKGDDAWELITSSLDGNQRQYVDEAVVLPAVYVYRLHAFAGKNNSSFSEAGLGLPSVTTTEISNIGITTATSGGNVSSDGGFSVTARGVVWSSSQNPTTVNNQGITSDGVGPGSFTSNITNLQVRSVYYMRAYAINSIGIQYGEQLSFTTAGKVTNPVTGKTWMDRNLGASRAATNSSDDQAYGDLYQWGRLTDGHEKRNSGITSSLSNSDTPGHDNFITVDSSPYDWRSPRNDNLWQGVSGTNNPCPAGYRLPTEAEWNAERASWSSNDAAGAFNSPLRLLVAGYRDYSSGSLYNVGSYGNYWSAVGGTDARSLRFLSGSAGMGSNSRANGGSVRCIKD